MLRYGAPARDMRPLISQDLFLARLKLLIVMAKAFLKGYPTGDERTRAILDNARFVFYESIKHANPQLQSTPRESPCLAEQADRLDHLFFQRAQLLSIMCTSFAEGNTLGHFRRQALTDNIEHICGYFADRPRLSDITFLKVA